MVGYVVRVYRGGGRFSGANSSRRRGRYSYIYSRARSTTRSTGCRDVVPKRYRYNAPPVLPVLVVGCSSRNRTNVGHFFVFPSLISHSNGFTFNAPEYITLMWLPRRGRPPGLVHHRSFEPSTVCPPKLYYNRFRAAGGIARNERNKTSFVATRTTRTAVFTKIRSQRFARFFRIVSLPVYIRVRRIRSRRITTIIFAASRDRRSV